MPGRPLRLGNYKDRSDKENRGPSSSGGATAAAAAAAAAATSYQGSASGGAVFAQDGRADVYTVAELEDEGAKLLITFDH